MQVVVFEDYRVLKLKPLVNLKPVYGLYTGFRSLQEKLEYATRGRVKLTWHLRRYLAPFYAEQHPESLVNRLEERDVLLVNGRIVCDEAAARVIIEGVFDSGKAYMQGDNLLFARLDRSLMLDQEGALMPDLVDVERLAGELVQEKITGFRVIDNIWDLIAFHPDELLRDAETIELGHIGGDVHPSVAIVNHANVYVGPGAVVRAGAVLDADSGFVAIGSGAVVEPQAVLMQNVFLAPWSSAKIGAKLFSNVAVGMASKVGGEVEDSLIEPFANKQHDGFLGHSYISSWCNLGAGTNTSDLKNNYSEIKLRINGELQLTGLQFLGLLMGDHSKSSINSMFNTGTVVGTGANIFGGGFPPKEVPSFSWGGSGGIEKHDVEKAVETAKKVMARRKVTMSSAYESMFRFVAGMDVSGTSFI